ncbi:MAG: GH1 family beta-glucosidase [Bacteroidia bacterium]
MSRSDFGKDFLWGVATAAYQIEGGHDADGKSPSIWDTFSHKKNKIKTGENGDISCDFYHRYPEDLTLLKSLNFQVNRFSLAWSRILPEGTGKPNQKGIDFYHRVIDRTLELGMQPWITLYHWDLPQCLEDKGGWINRDIVSWFSEYVEVCTKAYGDKVKNWMVLNEPNAFVTLGYMLGMHAPGYKSPQKYLAAVHHATLCQAEGGRIIRKNVANANVGSTFSCTYVTPLDQHPINVKAAERYDALLNRMYLEPALGLGYPEKSLPILKRIDKFKQAGDEDKMKFDFDFIGIQNYTHDVARWFPIPFIWGTLKSAKDRNVPYTEMGWEVYPEGIYHLLKKFAAYKGIKNLIVTENGAAFPDVLAEGAVHDPKRVEFFQAYLASILKAKQEGVNVNGYFVWTFLDNFEWMEGYRPRFGLVHVDYATQKRTIKDSGKWFQEFLKP